MVRGIVRLSFHGGPTADDYGYRLCLGNSPVTVLCAHITRIPALISLYATKCANVDDSAKSLTGITGLMFGKFRSASFRGPSKHRHSVLETPRARDCPRDPGLPRRLSGTLSGKSRTQGVPGLRSPPAWTQSATRAGGFCKLRPVLQCRADRELNDSAREPFRFAGVMSAGDRVRACGRGVCRGHGDGYGQGRRADASARGPG